MLSHESNREGGTSRFRKKWVPGNESQHFFVFCVQFWGLCHFLDYSKTKKRNQIYFFSATPIHLFSANFERFCWETYPRGITRGHPPSVHSHQLHQSRLFMSAITTRQLGNVLATILPHPLLEWLASTQGTYMSTVCDLLTLTFQLWPYTHCS